MLVDTTDCFIGCQYIHTTISHFPHIHGSHSLEYDLYCVHMLSWAWGTACGVVLNHFGTLQGSLDSDLVSYRLSGLSTNQNKLIGQIDIDD